MASKPEPKARSYKDFLTPAMHRRFTSATTGALVLCYIYAVLASDANLFWRFFILGRPGIRTLLLFLSVLSVFIVRLANLQVGERNTASGFETLYQHLTSRFGGTSSPLLSSERCISGQEGMMRTWVGPTRENLGRSPDSTRTPLF